MIVHNIYVSGTNQTSDTLISCFPTIDPLDQSGENTSSTPDDLDVMASAMTVTDLESCTNVIDLLVILAHHSVNRTFDESTKGFVDMFSIYRWAAANKVCDGFNIFATTFVKAFQPPMG